MANYRSIYQPFGDFYSGGSLNLNYTSPIASAANVSATTDTSDDSSVDWTSIATTAINASAHVASAALGPGGIAGQQLPVAYQASGVTLPANTVSGSAPSTILILAGIAVVALLVMKKS